MPDFVPPKRKRGETKRPPLYLRALKRPPAVPGPREVAPPDPAVVAVACSLCQQPSTDRETLRCCGAPLCADCAGDVATLANCPSCQKEIDA